MMGLVSHIDYSRLMTHIDRNVVLLGALELVFLVVRMESQFHKRYVDLCKKSIHCRGYNLKEKYRQGVGELKMVENRCSDRSVLLITYDKLDSYCLPGKL